jgi:hypothetical protein
MDDMADWVCDTCGKKHQIGDARYTIADNEDAKTFRHWSCHTPIEKVFDKFRQALNTAEIAISRFKRDFD